jgi:hypothetical protein
MKYTADTASDDMIYVPSFMKIGSRSIQVIRVITWTIWEATVLILTPDGMTYT